MASSLGPFQMIEVDGFFCIFSGDRLSATRRNSDLVYDEYSLGFTAQARRPLDEEKNAFFQSTIDWPFVLSMGAYQLIQEHQDYVLLVGGIIV